MPRVFVYVYSEQIISFTAEQVLKRWDLIISKLKEDGINVLGISSDGDTRLLKAMRIKMMFGLKFPNFTEIGNGCSIPSFHATVLPEFLCTQDTVHIGAKLRTRFLKYSIIMPLGNFVISCGHLKILVDSVSKDKHCLNQKDLNPNDKMNFASVIKICDP